MNTLLDADAHGNTDANNLTSFLSGPYHRERNVKPVNAVPNLPENESTFLELTGLIRAGWAITNTAQH